MPKCVCGRSISQDKTFCVFCDPSISDEQKLKWRQSGGAQSKKIPHTLNPNDYRPLTPESLRRLYEDLIEATIEGHRDDLAGLIRDLSKVLPRVAELVAYDNLAFLNQRLNELEARKSGKLLTPKVNDNDNIVEYRQQD